MKKTTVSCTTKIIAGLVIGILLGGLFVILLQQKVFKQQNPDDAPKTVAKQEKDCAYNCRIAVTTSATGECPRGNDALVAGRTARPGGDQTTDRLLISRMNDLGWRASGGSSENGWSAGLFGRNGVAMYSCTAHGTSTQTVPITISFVGDCPPQEQVCPGGIMTNPPPDAKLSPEATEALVEATTNANNQLKACQNTMNEKCTQRTNETPSAYWETYDLQKNVTELLQKTQRFCDRRGMTRLKKYTSNEQFDPSDTSSMKYASQRLQTMQAYLQALSSAAEISKIKEFIEADLADTKSEVGGGLLNGSTSHLNSYPPLVRQDNKAYYPSQELMKDLGKGKIRSIWHIHALDAQGNPEQEGPSGDPDHPSSFHDDFSNPFSLTNGEAEITYIGKDANGKICFNVKFFTREFIVIDLGDYDP